MRVRPHASGTREAQVYVSDGLRALGQSELLISIVRRDGEDAESLDLAMAGLFGSVYAMASQKRLLGPGAMIELAEGGFVEPRFGGLACASGAWARALAPSGSTCVVPLTRGEVTVAKSAGVGRILARLGEACGQFPFPIAWDRDRADVSHGDEETKSIRMRVPRALVPGLSVTMTGSKITMRLPRGADGAMKQLFERVPADKAIALDAEPALDTDAWLTWKPAQAAPSAIAAQGRDPQRVAGHVLLIAPGAPNDAIRLTEDGFAALLTDPTCVAMREALATGKPYELVAGLTLAIEPAT